MINLARETHAPAQNTCRYALCGFSQEQPSFKRVYGFPVRAVEYHATMESYSDKRHIDIPNVVCVRACCTD
jgi:hypothetical protein